MVSKIFAELFSERKGRSDDELYDFAADPEMVRNLVGGQQDRAEGMRALVGTLLHELLSRGKLPSGERVSSTPAEAELLHSLGYTR